MNREDRNRMARFEQIITRFEAAEKEALFRLRSEGWSFRSVEDARRQMEAIRLELRGQAVSVERVAAWVRPAKGAADE